MKILKKVMPFITLKNILQVITFAISVASGATAILPIPEPDHSEAIIITRQILNLLALHVKNNSPEAIIEAHQEHPELLD
jgi:hypothetical protein